MRLKDNSITVEEAAKLMGVTPQFIRVGLREKRLPFGFAVKMNSQYSYCILKPKFTEYTGIIIEED